MSVFDDDVSFWSRQLSEHALFLHLGIVDDKLRNDALVIHQDWEDIRESGAGLLEILNAVTVLDDLCAEVLERLLKGEWLGWIFPTFVDHILREQRLFRSHISGVSVPGGELCNWLRFMAEHADFAASLLDQSEQRLIREALKQAEEFTHLGQVCAVLAPQLLALSMKAGQGLDVYFSKSGIGTPAVKSIIHPALAAHVVREGQRFLQTIKELKEIQ